MTLLLPSPSPAGDALTTPGLPSRLPSARGPVSDELLNHLTRGVHEMTSLPLAGADPLLDDDAALALYLCYELHYLGLPGVDEAWEWEPSLLRERRKLEAALEASLFAVAGPVPVGLSRPAVLDELRRLAGNGTGPSLSAHMETNGTADQMREFAIHRSAYQLKEADPHTWGIPRVTGRAKAALVEIQRGEYGDGDVHKVHANLFAQVMAELGLDATYGDHIDRLPAISLATCNLVSLLGLHRRWRGALLGHLALFEMCSVGPMRRYAAALERLGFGPRATDFYDAHVIADEHHQVIALDDMVAGLVDDEPYLGGEIVFGARALAAIEARFTEHLLTAWADGLSSLRPPIGTTT